jgi:hypothetical protein
MNNKPVAVPITLSVEQSLEARELNEGMVTFSYRDGSDVYIETEDGIDPYVWRDNTWKSTKD